MAIDDIVIDRTSEQLINAIDTVRDEVGTESTALGIGTTGAVASGDNSVAVGSNAFSEADNSVSVGAYASADAENAIAIGSDATATKTGAIQIGNGDNNTANTVRIKNITILDANGKIPFSTLQGSEVVGLAVNASNHLIVTYADGTTADLGAIGGGGTGNYNELSNQPQVNGNTLIGNKTSSQLGLQVEIIKPLPEIAYTYTTISQVVDDTTNLPDGWYIVEQDWSLNLLSGTSKTINDDDIIEIKRTTYTCYITIYGAISGEIRYRYNHQTATYGDFVNNEQVYIKREIDNMLAQKQNKLNFDNTPTAGSNNPVTSGGVKTYVDTAVGDINTALTGLVSGGGVV